MPFSKHSYSVEILCPFYISSSGCPLHLSFRSLPDLCSAKPAHLVHHTLMRSPSIIVQRSYPSSISMMNISLMVITKPLCRQAPPPRHLHFMLACVFLFSTFIHTDWLSSCVGLHVLPFGSLPVFQNYFPLAFCPQ